MKVCLVLIHQNDKKGMGGTAANPSQPGPQLSESSERLMNLSECIGCIQPEWIVGRLIGLLTIVPFFLLLTN